MLGSLSPMSNGVRTREDLEKKVQEQAEQIKKLAESLHNQQLKFQQLQQKYQQLHNENAVLKASGKTGGDDQGGIMSELSKKDAMLDRMKREAKQVIDALKKKHAEEIEALKASHLTLSPASSSSRAAAGDPSSSHQGPAAHVAALTAELGEARGRISELEVKLNAAEEAQVDKEWLEADLMAAKSEIENLKKDLALAQANSHVRDGAKEHEKEMKRLIEESKRLKETNEEMKSAVAAAEQGKLTLQSALAAMEREVGEKKQQEEKREETARLLEKELEEATGEIKTLRAKIFELEEDGELLRKDLEATKRKLEEQQAKFEEEKLASEERLQSSSKSPTTSLQLGDMQGEVCLIVRQVLEAIDLANLVEADGKSLVQEACSLQEQQAAREKESREMKLEVNEKESKIEGLQSQLAEQKQLVFEHQQTVQELKRAKASMEEELESLQVENKKQKEQITKIKNEAQKATDKSKTLVEEAQMAKIELEKDLVQYQEKIATQDARIAELQNERQTLMAVRAELASHKSEWEALESQLRQQLQESEEERSRAEEREAILRQKAEELEETMARQGNAHEVQELEMQLREANEKLAKLMQHEEHVETMHKADVDHLRSENQALREKNDKYRQILQRVKDERAQEEQQKLKDEQVEAAHKQEIEKLREKILELQAAPSHASASNGFVAYSDLMNAREEISQLEEELRAARMESQMLRRELQGHNQQQEEGVNRDAFPSAGDRLGPEAEWSNWQGASTFANPAAPSALESSAACSSSSPGAFQELRHDEEGVAFYSQRALCLASEEEVQSALSNIEGLLEKCRADCPPSSAVLTRLVSEVELLRPMVSLREPAGETVEVRSWEELSMLLFVNSDMPDGSPFVFCGMPDSESRLLTSAQQVSERCQDKELAIVENFRKEASKRLSTSASALEWMALGHRNGLPTRMIDFCSSPLAAVHCATLGAEDKPGVVWAVDASVCHESSHFFPLWKQDASWWKASARRGRARGFSGGKVMSGEEFEDFVLYGKEKAERERGMEMGMEEDRNQPLGHEERVEAIDLQVFGDSVFFVEPTIPGESLSSTSSSSMQQGHIVAIMADRYRRLEEWLTRRPGAYRRILIPARLKRSIRSRLDQSGLTEKTLQPGLDGLCKWIRRCHT
mmetsp:Transcript_45805/g.143697  ORF Transcript_45805/g.143697 Transcript_45805/m.143697 type:complete len:1146 (-) Transcript_45805:21-3458(-)